MNMPFTNGRAIASANLIVGGVVALILGVMVAAVLLTIYAPEGRDIIAIVAPLTAVLALVIPLLLGMVKAGEAAAAAQVAAVRATEAAQVSTEAKTIAQETKGNLEVVHNVVNSKMDALKDASEAKAALEATLVERAKSDMRAELRQIMVEERAAAIEERTRRATLDAVQDTATQVAAATALAPPGEAPATAPDAPGTSSAQAVAETKETVVKAVQAAQTVLDDASRTVGETPPPKDGAS